MTDTYLNFRVIVSQFVQFRGSKRNKNAKAKKKGVSGYGCYKFGIPAETNQPKHNDALGVL